MYRLSRIFYTWLIAAPPAYLFVSLIAMTRGLAKQTITYTDLQFLLIAFGIVTMASLAASVFLNFMFRRFDANLEPMVRDLLSFWIKIIPYIVLGFCAPVPLIVATTDAGLRTFYTTAAAFLAFNFGCWTIHSIYYALNTRRIA